MADSPFLAQKRCTNCWRELPATLEYFPPYTFPSLFRVLCHNCNCSRSFSGLTEADITGQVEQAAD